MSTASNAARASRGPSTGTRPTSEYRRSETGAPFERQWVWRGWAVAGFVAAVAMDFVISLMQLSALRVAIAGLYGFEGSLVAGWVAHLTRGSLFGVVFAAVLADPGLYRVSEWVRKTAVAGVVHGLVPAAVGAGIVVPIRLDVVGASMATSIPNVTVPLLVWHAVYGLVLGGLFPFVEEVSGAGNPPVRARSAAVERPRSYLVCTDVKRLSTRARE